MEIVPSGSINCPSKQELIEFLSGDVAEKEFEASLAQHVDHCKVCQRICDGLTIPESPVILPKTEWDHRLQWLLKSLKQRRADQTMASEETAGASLNEDRTYVAPNHLGGYRILERIGGGSQGLLFRAVDEALLREVAIKIIRPGTTATESSRVRFLREARAAGKLRSEHVVPIHQVVMATEDQPYLVMEFVRGESLKQKLERTPRLPDREIAEIARQIASGLVAAHANGIVHRDIKPSNVLIDEATGRVRITDFGLALNSTDLAKMTSENAIAGTPAYMSPEQVVEPESVGHASDIYSLGVVLYEMLAGELPFRGDVRMTLAQLVHDDPKPPSKLRENTPRDLEVICLKALAKEPGKRFDSAQAMLEELTRWLEGMPILSRPTSRRELAMRWCKKNQLVVGLTSLIFGLLLAIAGVLVVATSRLTVANKRIHMAAVQSAEQRDAALRTLERIIFQLQDRFDDQVVDLDQLQLSSLSIAIDGLRKVRAVDGLHSIADLTFADALRRYGEIVLRSGLGEEGESYLQEAEAILKKLVNESEMNRQAMRALAETIWIKHEHVEESSIQDLQEATRWARTAWMEEDEGSSIFLGDALLRESRQWMQDDEWNRAEPLLLEAKNRLDGVQMNVETEEQFRSYSAWLETMDRLVALKLWSKDRAAALALFREASESIKASEKWSDSKRVLQTQLSMLDRLGAIGSASSGTSESLQEDRLVDQYRPLVRKLTMFAETDSLHFDEIVDMISEVAQDRIDEEHESSAIQLFLLELDIILARSAHLPDQEDVCIHLAMCHLNLAELFSDQGKKSDARQHILSALQANERCVDTADFELEDWRSIAWMYELGRKLLGDHEVLRNAAPKTLTAIQAAIVAASEGQKQRLERVKRRVEKSIR